MQELLKQIRDCRHCEESLPMGPRPVVAAFRESRIVIIGQAPGKRVHQTGIPWDDPSGKELRRWLGVSGELFYESGLIALVPMGFCYPGKGSAGDLPPRKECAPLWHESLMQSMPDVRLTLLIGTYAQAHYLGEKRKRNLTETVRAFWEYLPEYFPLPHPSPRNRFWIAKNDWFVSQVLPELQGLVRGLIRE